MNIDASLLRERFVIKEKNSKHGGRHLHIHCPSTRMIINLQAGEMPTETYVVRTFNMHSCTRVVNQLIAEYEQRGPLLSRAIKLDWDEMWETTLSRYDHLYHPERWVSIYNKGRMVYSFGKHHTFFDVIEKCDAVSKGNYVNSIQLAENSFKQAGKEIDINYDSNVALVAVLNNQGGRCSMVLRSPSHTTTFNYSLSSYQEKGTVNITQGLSTAADFLEGVQLSYMVGINLEKLTQGLIEPYSDDGRKTKKARERIYELNSKINSMENRYSARYRPERPNFNLLIQETEKYARDHILNDHEDDACID